MNETLNWLAEQCTENLLSEKWLLCADLRSGQTWKDRLNLAGTATVNLHAKSVRSLVLGLVNQSLASEKLTYLNADGARALIHDLILDAQRAKSLVYFSGVEYSESLAKLLSNSFRDLRLATISVEAIRNEAFHSHAKASDVRRLYQAYCDALERRNLIDFAGCLERAFEGLVRGSIKFPSELMVLVPNELQFSYAEDRFLKKLGECIPIKCPASPTTTPADVRNRLVQFAQQRSDAVEYLAGYGEANEVRAVIQRALGGTEHTPPHFDEMELVVTDLATYGPLLYESFSCWMERRSGLSNAENQSSLDIPLTFSEGFACIYSRPGRALRAWLRWIRNDCVQSKAVQMIREGLLQRPENAVDIGYARLASQLRKLSIGFQGDRYLPILQNAIVEARRRQQEFRNRREQDENGYDDDAPREYGLRTLQALEAMMQPLMQYAPTDSDTATDVLRKSKKFLLQCARSDDKLDRIARNKLLDDIDARIASLQFADESASAVRAWLENLPIESCVLASGPQPGCLHITSLDSGGIAGRRQVFLMGLDANRFPRSAAIDPVLLDDERERLSSNLQTAAQRAQRSELALLQKLDQALEVNRVELRFSFSTRNLIEGRSQSPSPSLVEIFRLTQNQPQAHIDDLLGYIGPPAAFASAKADHWMDPSEGFLASLLMDADESQCWARVESLHPQFGERAFAMQQREKSTFSNHDGLVPEAGIELTPAHPKRQASPSRLETYGTCPRQFLFKYGLGVFPPDEWTADEDRWLDSLQFGKLVHSLFEKFLRMLIVEEVTPDLDRDLPRMLELLKQEIAIYQADVPVRNEDAFQQQHEILEAMCEIFLREEQRYCEAAGAKPWILESSIGLESEPQSPIDTTEPVSVTLRDGRSLRLGGRIDRIDRLQQAGNGQYLIWDYKSGSSYGFNQANPFQQGRKLQSFLYTRMLERRLAAVGLDSNATTGFGYFFPHPKTEGQRLQWTAGELKDGDAILQNLCDAISVGLFPATTNKDDCTYCPFIQVCKQPEVVAADSLRKSLEPCNREQLKPWCDLRDL